MTWKESSNIMIQFENILRCWGKVNGLEYLLMNKSLQFKPCKKRFRINSISRTLKKQHETKSNRYYPTNHLVISPGFQIESKWRQTINLNIPCLCITCKNLTITLEDGLIMTWRLPVFSALLIVCRASAKTEVRVIMIQTNTPKHVSTRRNNLNEELGVAVHLEENLTDQKVSHKTVYRILRSLPSLRGRENC